MVLYGHFGSCSATSKVVRGTERKHNLIANSCPVSGNTQQLLWLGIVNHVPMEKRGLGSGELEYERTVNDDEEIRGDKRKLTQLRDHEERGPS